MPLPLLMLQITFCQMSDQSWKITNWLIKRGYLLLKICHRWSQPDSITIQFILTCKELWQVICYCDYLVESLPIEIPSIHSDVIFKNVYFAYCLTPWVKMLGLIHSELFSWMTTFTTRYHFIERRNDIK